MKAVKKKVNEIKEMSKECKINDNRYFQKNWYKNKKKLIDETRKISKKVLYLTIRQSYLSNSNVL